MIIKFLKDASNLSVVNLLAQASALITFPIYSRFLQMEDYGLYDFIMLISVLAAALFSLESHQGLLRLLAGKESPSERSAMVGSVFWFNVVLGGLLMSAVIAAALITEGVMFGVTAHPVVFAAAAFSWWLTLLKQQLVGAHRALLDTAAVARTGVVAFCVQLPLGIFVIAGMGWGVIGLFLSVGAGSLIQLSLLAMHAPVLVRPRADRAALKEVLVYSFPLAISTLGAIGWLYVDRYIAKEFIGLYGVGLLGIAYRFAGPVALISSTIGMALAPLVYAFHEHPATTRKVARLFDYYVAMSMFAVACMVGYGEVVLKLLAPVEYHAAAVLFPFIGAALLIRGAIQFFPGLIVAKKTGVFAVIQLLGLAVNAALSLIVVKTYGVLGVSAVSVLTGGISLIVIALAGHRHLPVVIHWPRVGLACVFTAGLVGAVHWDIGGDLLGYLAPVIALVFALAVRLVAFSDMKDLWGMRK